MIYSPNRTVRPDPMLVYLTLVSCKEEEDIRKESLLKASGPTHDRSEGKSVQDASAPPSQADQADQRDIEMSDEVETEFNAKKTVNDGGHGGGDSASPPTLRGDEDVGMLDTEEGSQSRGRENKENLPPSLSSEGSSPDVPIGDSCPSGANEQSGPPKSGKETQEVSIDLAVGTGAATGQESSVIYDTLDTAPPPERPPPIPPRPQDDKTELLRQAETRLTKQHDVTEKMGAVLDQLQYAIKAEDVDEDTGAQIDTVKRLFYNKQKEYSIDTGGAIRCTQEVYQSDIKVNAKFGSIHAALDDAIYRPEESQYTTISQLPPVLQILVGRTGYKRETNTSFKIENHLKLEEKIYMDRYMDFSEKTDLAERHRKIWGWKKKIENLEDRKLKVTTSPVSINQKFQVTVADL